MPSHWEHLIACIKSGQMSDCQVQAEMQNSHFRAYVRQRDGLTPPTGFCQPKGKAV